MKLADVERFLLPVERNDWNELLAAWKPLIPLESSRWLLSRFGELFLEHKDGKIGVLQVSSFQYKIIAKGKKDFEEWLVDPDKWSEWFLSPLINHLELSGKILKPDCCYSFIKPLGLGGQLTLENVMVIPIREHFGLWGEIFQQIKDVPDGAEVVLKVERKN
jgi:hypothetical protein